MSPSPWCLLVVACLSVCASTARAESVLLRETPGLREGLCVALRIQLTGVAEVRCEHDAAGLALSDRLAAATTRAREVGASIGVLLERDPDPRHVRMYLVGARAEQAVIALERIENRADADVDRSLALEVQSALDALHALAVPPPAAPSLVSVRVAPSAPRARWRLVAEAGGMLSVGSSRRYGGAAGLGVRIATRARFGELVVAGRSLSDAHGRRNGAELDVEEWGAALELRAGRTLRWLSLGGLIALGAERVHARGRARDGSVGGVRLGIARLAAGLELRCRVARGAALRLAPTLELYPLQHRFAVDGAVLDSIGRARFALPLVLSVALPFDSRGEPDHAR